MLKQVHQSQLYKKYKIMKVETDLKSSNHQERIETTMGAMLGKFNTGDDQIMMLIQMETQFRLEYVNLEYTN